MPGLLLQKFGAQISICSTRDSSAGDHYYRVARGHEMPGSVLHGKLGAALLGDQLPRISHTLYGNQATFCYDVLILNKLH